MPHASFVLDLYLKASAGTVFLILISMPKCRLLDTYMPNWHLMTYLTLKGSSQLNVLMPAMVNCVCGHWFDFLSMHTLLRACMFCKEHLNSLPLHSTLIRKVFLCLAGRV